MKASDPSDRVSNVPFRRGRRYTAAMPRNTSLFVVLLAFASAVTGCLTFQTRTPVSDANGVRVFLRSDNTVSGGVEKGYSHPAIISNVRVTHVLSRLDLRTTIKDGNRREPAVPTTLLSDIAEGLSQGLAKAEPDDQVVVMAVRNDHSFGVFDKKYLTSLLAFVRDDRLYIFVDQSDELIQKRSRAEEPREPRLDARHKKFRLYGGESMEVIDSQTVSVAWRSDIFTRPTRTKTLPSGQVRRKEILLEEPVPDAAETPPVGALPARLSPSQLRDLADLEEARQAGHITEAEYQSRRAVIVDGGS